MSFGKPPSDSALQDYFDNLLQDAPPAAAVHATVDAPIKIAAGGTVAALSSAARPARTAAARPYAEPIRTLNLRMPLPPVSAPAIAEVPIAAPSIDPEPTEKPEEEAAPPPILEGKESDAPEIKEPVDATDLVTMAPPADWFANGRPGWAQQPFECLIFRAGGLLLAAPLVELGSIYTLDDGGLTSIFGQTSWFIGLLPVKDYTVRAIDTALAVMPERYSATMRDNYRYIVTLHGSDWGLAVDEVVNTIVLNPNHIRWRGQRGKRPWLAGTLIDQMCALFDIAQLAWLFHTQDRKRAPA
ncbi:MAG TPA: chemotaxis protein CheW [Spongiibacteraceae bacterium]|jgi:purine-binding chemotaxis protein CheW